MEEHSKQASLIIKWLKLVLKIAVMAVCLWYVSGKIDFAKATEVLQQSNWLLLFAALIVFIISKLISAVRLNIYFRNIGIGLSQLQNTRLYLLGMFYNLFLPGSVSGDAYKVILLTKKYAVPYKQTTAAVLLDRFSGLLGLGIILAAYSFILLQPVLSVILAAGSLAAVAGLYFIIQRWFSFFLSSYWSTLLLGFGVQAVQVICIYIIMSAVGIETNQTAYIFIFLVSSVVSVLPLTIGGLGIREVVFLEGASYLGLLKESSVIISLLFYLITLLTSATGAWYIFVDPLKKRRTQY
jgi:glycosyltransferase 2 family protein